MHRGIEIVLIVTFSLVLAVRSDDILKCYMCTSLTNPGCDSDPEAHNLQPVECTLSQMVEWQQTLQNDNVLRQIASIFEIDNLQHHQASAPMACAKMVLKVHNQDITMKSCQTAKTETLDPCKAIEGKLSPNFFQLQHCDLCMHDACNSSIAPSPKILFVLLSIFGTITLGVLYNGA